MKNGICPKCSQRSVYRLEDGIGSSECQYISKGGWGKTTTTFDSYLCTSCGYFENYVSKLSHLEAIANGGKWKKVIA